MDNAQLLAVGIKSMTLIACFFLSLKLLSRFFVSRTHLAVFNRKANRIENDLSDRYETARKNLTIIVGKVDKHCLQMTRKCTMKIESLEKKIETLETKIETLETKNSKSLKNEIERLQELIVDNAQEINEIAAKMGFDT